VEKVSFEPTNIISNAPIIGIVRFVDNRIGRLLFTQLVQVFIFIYLK